jgi:NADPH-dependent ferric siderophore reductase
VNAVSPLSAETLIPLSAPLQVMSDLRDAFGEFGEIAGIDSAWSAAFDIGKTSAHLRENGIAFRVEAGDDTSLAFLQWSVAEHVVGLASGETPDIVWHGGTMAGAPLPYFRELTVVRAVQVTPKLRRVTLKGHDLARFARDGLHIRLLLAPRPGVTPVWPVMAADGRQAWPEGERPVLRVYTLRRIDVGAGEVDIDFVLHEGDTMPGARFGAEAQPGMVVGMMGPGGSTIKPAPRYVFAGDETGLPAIARMLEELPEGVAATVLLEVADIHEIQELPARENVEVRWLPRDGLQGGTTVSLADAVVALDETALNADTFVWAGCEHAAARTIRKFLKQDRQHPRDRYLVAAYWRRGQAGEIVEA